jgi:tRNA (guanine37-N1)-methyltransferase
MIIDILTLFPEAVMSLLHESIIGRASQNGLVSINCYQIRDYTQNKQKQVDDYPYGGGQGMIMQADPLYRSHEAVLNRYACKHIHTILTSPQGTVFDQNKARSLLSQEHIILVCGHYEGVDERFIEECVDEEISLGDFVMTGGEIAAAAISDAVCRMVPGVLSGEECFTDESHFSGLLEYPQYSRPEIWHEKAVPKILLSGHHQNIKNWRRQQSLLRTLTRRPDMFDKTVLSVDDKKLMKDLK